MGYYIKSKKINMVLNEEQQQVIYNMWTNPSEEAQKNNFALHVLPRVFRGEYFNDIEKCNNMKDLLDAIGFVYEDTKKGLKLKSHMAKRRHQRDLFHCVGHLINNGNFMTFRGEDGKLMGFFFNGKELIDYASYEELKKLIANYKLNKNIEKEVQQSKKLKI